MLLAGAKLGVFDALSERPGTAAELAPKLKLSTEGLERLLRALNGLGYLKRDRGTYSLRPIAKKWLSRTSKNDNVRRVAGAGVERGEGVEEEGEGFHESVSPARALRPPSEFRNRPPPMW
jgi:hypothetical protein